MPKMVWPLTSEPLRYDRLLYAAPASPVYPSEAWLYVVDPPSPDPRPLEVYHYFPTIPGSNNTVTILDPKWFEGYDEIVGAPSHDDLSPQAVVDAPYFTTDALSRLVDEYIAVRNLQDGVEAALRAVQ
jgi:hypothetical protein